MFDSRKEGGDFKLKGRKVFFITPVIRLIPVTSLVIIVILVLLPTPFRRCTALRAGSARGWRVQHLRGGLSGRKLRASVDGEMRHCVHHRL